MRLWMLMVAAALLLMACSQQLKFVCPDGTAVDDSAKCSQKQVETAPVPSPEPPTSPPPTPPEATPTPEVPPIENVLPQEAASLFDKAKAKIVSVKYQYQGPPHDTEIYTVYFKGDKMRVDLPKGADEIHRLNYDTVYIDLAANKGRAFCERDRNLCKGIDSIVVTPADYFFKTPFDWIKDIKGGAVKGTQPIDGRDSLKLVEGNTTAWIDTYSGLPILIRIGDDTGDLANQPVKYAYKGLSINSVLDRDLVHQPIS